MVPASPSVLWKMATPRRYTDKDYMNRIAADIYGGAFRRDPSLIGRHAGAMHGARDLGYLYQLFAIAGWTSLPWLWSLQQPTLVLMGRDDPLVPPINGHILAGLIPNAELRMIDDGHLFIVTRPEETAAVIEAFLGDTSKHVAPSSPLARLFSWGAARGEEIMTDLQRSDTPASPELPNAASPQIAGRNRWPISRQNQSGKQTLLHLQSKAISTG
jgi:hypothetical protein